MRNGAAGDEVGWGFGELILVVSFFVYHIILFLGRIKLIKILFHSSVPFLSSSNHSLLQIILYKIIKV